MFEHRTKSSNIELRRLLPNEPGHEKMCLISYANNKGADQPEALFFAA